MSARRRALAPATAPPAELCKECPQPARKLRGRREEEGAVQGDQDAGSALNPHTNAAAATSPIRGVPRNSQASMVSVADPPAAARTRHGASKTYKSTSCGPRSPSRTTNVTASTIRWARATPHAERRLAGHRWLR